jgi:choline-glycine betaine transporter
MDDAIKFLAAVTLLIGVLIAIVGLTTLAWNYIMHGVFGLPSLTWQQIIVLQFLINVLFSSLVIKK